MKQYYKVRIINSKAVQVNIKVALRWVTENANSALLWSDVKLQALRALIAGNREKHGFNISSLIDRQEN